MIHFNLKTEAITARRLARRHSPRAAFTLIEIMVALAILLLMMVVMFVPLNMGVNVTQIGKSRADIQQASQIALDRMERELRQAIYVYPNDVLPGVTDKAPFNSQSPTPAGTPTAPYYRLGGVAAITEAYYDSSTTPGACSVFGSTPYAERVGNTSRIDFILPKRGANSLIQTPVEGEAYLVTYYVRRRDVSKLYDAISNPLVLYRAQYPLQINGASPENAQTNSMRYPSQTNCLTNPTGFNRGAAWLCQSSFGEPNLEPICDDDTINNVEASHIQLTPAGMGLIAPLASPPSFVSPTPTPSYQPNSSFELEDSNRDGKIDRVKITLTLGQFDGAGASVTDQRVTLSNQFDLSNIR